MPGSRIDRIVGISGLEDNETTWKPINVDKVSGAIVAIEIEHHEVHEEKLYTVSDVDTDIDTQTPKYYRITSPNTSVRVHFKAIVQTLNPATIFFYENPTITGAGAGLSANNNNRNSINVATATCFGDTTVSNDGTLLQAIRAGGGTAAAARIGGDARPAAEWILKQNEDYIIKIVSDNDNNQATTTLQWYEEPM